MENRSAKGGLLVFRMKLKIFQVVERLKVSQEKRKGKQNFLAMYSSILGGITTDPATMVIPLDDHMVHRGHGVFDTAAIMDGYLYELDQHIDRFLRSASMAKISLPFDRSSIRSILIQTVSASKCAQGSLRYWLSAGPGDFLLSPSGCYNPALYAVVIQDQSPLDRKGVKVVTSTILIKTPQFSIMKSVNYLPNVLSKMEAEEKGGYAAIWLDDEGYVAEGPNMNVAFVTKEKEFVTPYFDKILSGCTVKRVLGLAERLVKEGILSGIRVGNVGLEEGKMADEMMLIGSGILVRSVLQWDEQIIGNGREGPVAQALLDLILEDMKSGPAKVRVPVPY
ncbi:D-amino-acid transaminase, chloroplastic-like isoform X3 [Tasmannia lanceolata]|uniref:D-amino-acid transaminase, chloroplastic-like isoform X3 n=1 Tax=Tasmannia lanceolata TaxID=3420 RepID=UPI0040642447